MLLVRFSVLEGILRYPEEDVYGCYAKAMGDAAEPESQLRPAVLVVDPKEELGEIVKREARGRRVIRVSYGERGPVLHLFEGHPLGSLDAFEALDLMLQQSDFFNEDQARTREPVWNRQAASILRDFMAIDMWLAKRGLEQVKELWDMVRTMLGLHDLYKSFLSSLAYDPVNYFKPHNTLLNLSVGEQDGLPLATYLDASDRLGVPGELKTRLASLSGLYHSTRSGVIWMANGILSDLASEEFASCVCVNPFEAPPQSRLLSVKDALNCGDLVVYAPASSSPITGEDYTSIREENRIGNIHAHIDDIFRARGARFTGLLRTAAGCTTLASSVISKPASTRPYGFTPPPASAQ